MRFYSVLVGGKPHEHRESSIKLSAKYSAIICVWLATSEHQFLVIRRTLLTSIARHIFSESTNRNWHQKFPGKNCKPYIFAFYGSNSLEWNRSCHHSVALDYTLQMRKPIFWVPADERTATASACPASSVLQTRFLLLLLFFSGEICINSAYHVTRYDGLG